MGEMVLLAEFSLREEARARAIELAAALGKCPTVKRSDGGWGLFAPKELADKVRMDRTPPRSGSKKLTPTKPTPPNAPSKREPDRTARKLVTATGAMASTGRQQRPSVDSGTLPARGRTWAITPAEARRMAEELRYAYRKLSSRDASEWMSRTVERFAFVSARRVRNLAGLTLTIAEVTGDEIIGLIKAILDKRATKHLVRRMDAGTEKAADFVKGIRHKAAPIIADLQRNPGEVAPDLFVAALAFYAAGGGFDGDGGIPDSDITLVGIEAHRSVFTHSIVAGAIVETTLYSLVDFIAIAHRHLPNKHDRRWTVIHERFQEAAASGARGMSLGLAYHLGVDGIVQPGAYHDIPFELSMEGHQAILTTNAIAEGLDSTRKQSANTRRRAVARGSTSAPPPVPEPRERKVASIVTGAAALALLLLGIG